MDAITLTGLKLYEKEENLHLDNFKKGIHDFMFRLEQRVKTENHKGVDFHAVRMSDDRNKYLTICFANQNVYAAVCVQDSDQKYHLEREVETQDLLNMRKKDWMTLQVRMDNALDCPEKNVDVMKGLAGLWGKEVVKILAERSQDPEYNKNSSIDTILSDATLRTTIMAIKKEEYIGRLDSTKYQEDMERA